jgi:hypothetical protein
MLPAPVHRNRGILTSLQYYCPNFPFVIQITEKWQTSQSYIIRILQLFATKLWNITNFVMLFQAAVKFLSGLV